MTHASSQPTEAVLARHRCIGDDGMRLIVLELRHALHQQTSASSVPLQHRALKLPCCEATTTAELLRALPLCRRFPGLPTRKCPVSVTFLMYLG